MTVRAFPLGFECGFAMPCPFACSFGNRGRAWQEISKILACAAGTVGGRMFAASARDVALAIEWELLGPDWARWRFSCLAVPVAQGQMPQRLE